MIVKFEDENPLVAVDVWVHWCENNVDNTTATDRLRFLHQAWTAGVISLHVSDKNYSEICKKRGVKNGNT